MERGPGILPYKDYTGPLKNIKIHYNHKLNIFKVQFNLCTKNTNYVSTEEIGSEK